MVTAAEARQITQQPDLIEVTMKEIFYLIKAAATKGENHLIFYPPTALETQVTQRLIYLGYSISKHKAAPHTTVYW